MKKSEMIEQYLKELATGTISEVEAFTKLSQCGVHTGLDLNYYEQSFKVANVSSITSSFDNLLVFTNRAQGNTDYNSCSKQLVQVAQLSDSLDETIHHLASATGKKKLIVIDLDTETLQNQFKAECDFLQYIYRMVQTVLNDKVNCRIMCLFNYIEENPFCCAIQALSGFAKTLYQENQDVVLRVIGYVQAEVKQSNHWIEDIIRAEYQDSSLQYEVLYKENRYVSQLNKRTVSPISQNSFVIGSQSGCYVIAGGLGKIGIVTANYLLKNSKHQLILLGRSNVNRNKLQNIFGDNSNRVQYYRVNIANKSELDGVYQDIKSKGIVVNGIIHCAGIFRNSFILKKDMKEVQEVLAGKVSGIRNLHDVFINEKLQIFCSYSSIAGVFGKVGQADYAYANSFLNFFTKYRERLVQQGRCFGKTICVNWPFWAEGGMEIEAYEVDQLYESIGITPLPDHVGMQAISQILKEQSGSYTVLYGKSEQIQYALQEGNEETMSESDSIIDLDINQMKEKTLQWLTKIFVDIFEVDESTIDIETGFNELGIDSIGFNRLQGKMEDQLGTMKKTLMYETRNIEELGAYLMETKANQLAELFQVHTKKQKPVAASAKQTKKTKNVVHKSNPVVTQSDDEDEIAIIGMSGRFPGANNCEELWDILSQGKDTVGEIPKNRWDVDFYNTGDFDHLPLGKSYCKWGGFLENVDCFDPQFFHMSPKEAQTTDPQERLFLEVAYETFEDAGYNRERLKQYEDDTKSPQVGVFVSCASNTYNLIGIEQWERGNYIVPNALPWSISNRVSYFMNFSGPSFTVDAACAGGIVSVHQAINALKNNECKMALAGGVNLYLHPYKYVSLSQVKMLSRTGKCYAFSNKADGFVPGESVSAILLKPLKEAIKDHDYIYGVVKASGINHDGQSNGYMAPNPYAQSSLVKSVLKMANMSARDISYIEAHGTGTPIGDPTEINALTSAFADTTNEKQFCSIGSIKTNIGHSEGAAAIVGIIKVLLQMKHQQLVPSRYADDVSKAIDFSQTPFVLQDKLSRWQRPVVVENGMKKEIARIGGISSFGAGGANGHIILEEFEQNVSIQQEEKTVQIIPISAKSEEQLRTYVTELKEFVLKNKNKINLSSLAYSLQVEKDDFEHKVAFITDDIDQLLNYFSCYIDGQINSSFIRTSHVRTSTQYANLAVLDHQEGYDKMSTVANLWLEGKVIKWNDLMDEPKELLHLPHYPFLMKRYWVNEVDKNKAIAPIREATKVVSQDTIKEVKQASNEIDEITDIIEKDEIDIDKIRSVLKNVL